jgi:hypothetical protein
MAKVKVKRVRTDGLGAVEGSRWWTRWGVNSHFSNLNALANRNKCRIKLIGLVKIIPLYLSSLAPCKDPN